MLFRSAAIQPSADDRLTITVDSAPWVPVEEIRVIVNGEVVQHLTDGIANATDPFAKKGTNRFYTTIPLTDILPAEGDAWIVVEAGTALADQDDLDCDGIPDTGDNDGDGDIDADDVDTDGDLDVDADDLANPPTADEAGCLDVTGPLAEPPTPERGTPAWYFRQVNPNKGYPMSFTNPFLIDRDGDGEFTGVPR